MTKSEMKEKAKEEIRDAQNYFEIAEQMDDKEMACEFITMGKEELGHAGRLYGMAARE